MPEIALSSEGGQVFFRVSWLEPMSQVVETRQEADRLVAWLRTNGLTVDVDGDCEPCRAHHQSQHRCPSCSADLGLRVGFVAEAARRFVRALPRSAVEGFAVARLQHVMRVQIARRAREAWIDECQRADREVEAAVG